MKKLRYIVEALLLHFMMLLFRAMPIDTASNIGGFIGRNVGPCLATSRKALKNIQHALPHLTAEEHTQAIIDMWDNLGRVMAEYPHLEHISKHRTQMIGKEKLQTLIHNNKPAVCVGSHMANWEVDCSIVYTQLGGTLEFTYRAPNNPWSDKMLLKARSLKGKIKGHAKSRNTGKNLIEALKSNHLLGVLLDQKFNEGIAVPFFGMEAMTNPVFISLCQKYNAPFIPIQNIRTHGANLQMIIHDPIPLHNADQTPRNPVDVLNDFHGLLEEWIKQHPGQWLWLHRRWSSKAMQKKIS